MLVALAQTSSTVNLKFPAGFAAAWSKFRGPKVPVGISARVWLCAVLSIMSVDDWFIVCMSERMCAYLFAGGWAAAKEAARRDHCYHQSARETQHKISSESHTLTQNTLVNKEHCNGLTHHIVGILHNDVVFRSSCSYSVRARAGCSWPCMRLFVILML